MSALEWLCLSSFPIEGNKAIALAVAVLDCPANYPTMTLGVFFPYYVLVVPAYQRRATYAMSTIVKQKVGSHHYTPLHCSA